MMKKNNPKKANAKIRISTSEPKYLLVLLSDVRMPNSKEPFPALKASSGGVNARMNIMMKTTTKTIMKGKNVGYNINGAVPRNASQPVTKYVLPANIPWTHDRLGFSPFSYSQFSDWHKVGESVNMGG